MDCPRLPHTQAAQPGNAAARARDLLSAQGVQGPSATRPGRKSVQSMAPQPSLRSARLLCLWLPKSILLRGKNIHKAIQAAAAV